MERSSSQGYVVEVDYDSDRRVLRVRFRNDREYAYQEVSETRFEDLVSSDDMEGHLRRFVFGRHERARLR